MVLGGRRDRARRRRRRGARCCAIAGRWSARQSRRAPVPRVSPAVSGHDLRALRAAARAARRVSRRLRSRARRAHGGAARRSARWRSGPWPSPRRCWPPTAASQVRPPARCRGDGRRARGSGAARRAGDAPDVSAAARSRDRPDRTACCRRRRGASGSSWSRYWRDGHVRRRCGFWPTRAAATWRLIDPQSRADRADFAGASRRCPSIGGMRPAAVHVVSDAGAGLVRGRRLGADAGDGRHRAPDGARAVASGRSPPGCDVARTPCASLIGGRHLGAAAGSRRDVHRRDRRTSRSPTGSRAPGFFLHEFDLPAGALAGDGPLARLTVRSRLDGEHADRDGHRAVRPADTRLADVGVRRGLARSRVRPGGWRLALDLRAVDAAHRRCEHAQSPITLRVERPRRYFDDDPAVRLTAGDRVLGETSFRDRGSVERRRAARGAAGRAAGGSRSRPIGRSCRRNAAVAPDRRRLGLRVFGVNVAAQP